MNLEDAARAAEDSWITIAQEMKVNEDYFGFYESEFLTSVQQTIDDMLVEVAPVCFDNEAVETTAASAKSPVAMLVAAWNQFLRNHEKYTEWENAAIDDYLAEAAVAQP